MSPDPLRRLPAALLALVLLGAPAAAGGEPLAWRIPGEGEAARMVLLGSIHFGRPEMYPLPDAVEKGFAGADTLVVEIDLSAIAPLEAARLVAERGTLEPGQHVRQRLGPETWERLQETTRRFSLPLESLARHKPWIIATTLTGVALDTLGYREEHGVDHHFLGRAGKRRIVALETLEQQLALFDGFSEAESETFLLEVLDELAEGSRFFRDLTAAWDVGDEPRLLELTDRTLSGSAAARSARARLLDERNDAMAAKLAAMLREAPQRRYFVVVGAGHLIGPTGIVAQLTAAGFPVARLTGGP
jgi:uncharacterized protein YbaP (TraB family)